MMHRHITTTERYLHNAPRRAGTIRNAQAERLFP